MTWSYARAAARIETFAANAPNVIVERYDEGSAIRIRALHESFGKLGTPGRPLYDLPKGVAVIADSVQVYVNLVNYDEMRLEEGKETERSHARALSFLHLHYGALDRVVEELGAQRVDFHGARLHAVIAEPAGEANVGLRVARGLRLALEMMSLAEAANQTLAGGDYSTRFRVGIDAGMCVAVDSGRQDEREPLFVGSPANHAARLAEGDEPGIYLSPKIRQLFALPQFTGSLPATPRASEDELSRILAADPNASGRFNQSVLREDFNLDRVNRWAADIREHRSATLSADSFQFHSHQLPLRTIDYLQLMPSNSIRMPLVSLFADIDGYTAYIDHAVASSSVAEAVRNLYVIREEMNAVVQEDFDGRKVRYVGDCIHAVIADGPETSTDDRMSVGAGAMCAGAIRSSFELCKSRLPNLDSLGVAIGFELGPTPISRIGIRGERAVRVASSKATICSEQCQRECTGSETKIGDVAYGAASADIRALFQGQTAIDLTYDDLAMQSPGSFTTMGATEPVGEARAHSRN